LHIGADFTPDRRVINLRAARKIAPLPEFVRV
jgi:hypothetical protein